MRAVIQRVSSASISVDNKVITGIKNGLVIFLGVLKGDNSRDAEYLAKRITQLRIFSDPARKMNLCLKDVGGELLVVSQFTLCAELSGSGRRPSFEGAENPKTAEKLYLEFIQQLKDLQIKVEQGIFREYMVVHIENDGPVTFTLDTEKER